LESAHCKSRDLILRIILPVCAIWMMACTYKEAVEERMGPRGGIEKITFHSEALDTNLVGESSQRTANVYLPPSYHEDAGGRFPAVYLLHGYQGSYDQWMSAGDVWNIRDVMDSLIATNAVREMIIVMPDANNLFGGSFYTNSATTGNWEDYIASDLIQTVDQRYRTLATAASRGIAGHSMGGYGAIKLAMKHPDVFGAVYSLSACCLGWGGDLTPDNDAWSITLSLTDFRQLLPGEEDYLAQAFLAMSAAWSPDPENAPFFAECLVHRSDGALIRSQNAYSRWTSNMPVSMVEQYRTNLARLRGMAFDVGSNDPFTHIPLTNKSMAEALSRNGIQHEFEIHDGDHNNRAAERIERKLLPFFSRVLRFQSPPDSPSRAND